MHITKNRGQRIVDLVVQSNRRFLDRLDARQVDQSGLTEEIFQSRRDDFDKFLFQRDVATSLADADTAPRLSLPALII